MELLATVDWLVQREGCAMDVPALRQGLERWPGGPEAGQRKLRLFNDRLLEQAMIRLQQMPLEA